MKDLEPVAPRGLPGPSGHEESRIRVVVDGIHFAEISLMGRATAPKHELEAAFTAALREREKWKWGPPVQKRRWYCANCRDWMFPILKDGDMLCRCGHVIASYKDAGAGPVSKEGEA